MIVYTKGLESDYQIVDGRLRDVFLDERIRKAVCFLVEDRADPLTGDIRRVPIGTGFVIGKNLDDSDSELLPSDVVEYHGKPYAVYIATARHVILDSDPNQPIYLRFNTRKEGFVDRPTSPNDWIFHADTDVCIHHLRLSKPQVARDDSDGEQAVSCLPFSSLATMQYVRSIPFTAGYEVFFLGLFSGHHGKERMQPVMRFGNVSLMPHEKVDIYLTESDAKCDNLTPVDAYLVEARSWGGVSGSPVLFYYPALSPSNEALWVRFQLPAVLGLVHGQYVDDVSRQRLVNAGIAIVIPSEKIREVIMQPKLKDERKESLKKMEKERVRGVPVPMPSSVERFGDTLTEQGFEDVLKQVSSKLSEPESE